MTSPRCIVLVTAAFLLLLATPPVSSVLKQKLFSKVTATQLNTGGRLKSFTPIHKLNSVKKACFLDCLQTANCEFVCIGPNGITCDLFKLYVSAHWVGETSGTIYSSCYTSWGLPSNVIRPNMAVTYSDVASSLYPGVALIDGFAGRSLDSCFHTADVVQSYWQVDLGAPVRVEAVTLATYHTSRFTNVDIRLGNSSNHLSNPVFSSVVTSPNSNTITITGNVYAGRYLALSNQNNGYLAVCEIQVHQE